MLLPQLEAPFEEGADGKEVSDFLEESDALGTRRNLATSLQQRNLSIMSSGNTLHDQNNPRARKNMNGYQGTEPASLEGPRVLSVAETLDTLYMFAKLNVSGLPSKVMMATRYTVIEHCCCETESAKSRG